MPYYDYECKKCGKVKEIKSKIKDKPLMIICEDCKGECFPIINNINTTFTSYIVNNSDKTYMPRKLGG